MKEEAEPVLDSVLAQHPAEGDHVVVVHPDQVVRRDVRADDLSERAVDSFIAALEVALELGQPEAVMEQRPEGAVRVSVVIFFDILIGEVNRCGRDAGIRAELGFAAFTRLAGPAEPNPFMLAKRRRQRNGETPLRARFIGVRRLDAVRDGDQPTHRIALQPLLSSTALLMIPTSEYVCG